jgi:hypothetical protein
MYTRLPSLPVETLLDLGGVSGSTGHRRSSTLGVTSREGPIDVHDLEFRQSPAVWDKWKEIQLKGAANCLICDQQLILDVSLKLTSLTTGSHSL